MAVPYQMGSNPALGRLVDRLRGFDSVGALVVSLYLNLDPARQIDRSYRIVFKDLLRDARARLPAAWQRQLVDEEATIVAWLAGMIPGGIGLALFTCGPRGLWLTEFLPSAVADRLSVGPEPDIEPLLELTDDLDRFVVALVDEEHARIFQVALGAVVSVAEMEDERDSHVRPYLKLVAERLSTTLGLGNSGRLIIAGPVEATTVLVDLLPRHLAERLVAVERADMRAADDEVRRIAAKVRRSEVAEAERHLVEEDLPAAMARQGATSGLCTTLTAIWQRQVKTLLVGAPARPTGSDCTSCGWLDTMLLASCPACGSPMRPVTDLVAVAMSHTLDQAGTVEIVHGDAARRLDEVGKGIAALLRSPAEPVGAHEVEE